MPSASSIAKTEVLANNNMMIWWSRLRNRVAFPDLKFYSSKLKHFPD